MPVTARLQDDARMHTLDIDTPRSDGSGIARRMDRVEQAPLRRLGSGADIANTCAFLVSDQSGFITGQTISVNGGNYM